MIKESLLPKLQDFGWIQTTNKGYMLTVEGIENYLVWTIITLNKFQLPKQILNQFKQPNEQKLKFLRQNMIANKLVCTVWNIKLGRETVESTSFGFDLFDTMAFYTHPSKIRNAKIKTELKNGFSGLLKALSSMQNSNQTNTKSQSTISNKQKNKTRQTRNRQNHIKEDEFFNYSSVSDDFKKWGKL